MKKRTALIITLCALLIILLLVILYFAVWVPQATDITTVSVSELQQTNSADLVGVEDAISSSLADITDWPAYYDSVYVVKKKHFFTDTETIYMIPYVIADVMDVGTAGTVSWNFSLGVLLLTRDGSSVVPLSDSVKLKDSEFLVEANSNTFLFPEHSGSHLGYRELVALDNMELNEWGWYTLQFDVATKYSAGVASAECQALLQWTGSIVSAASARFAQPVTFEVNANIDYLNNVK